MLTDLAMASTRDHVDEKSGNAYRCRLTLLAPPDKYHALEGVLGTLTDWVDPYRQIIDVDEKSLGEDLYDGDKREPPSPNVKGILVTPALSVMLFMRETGEMCVNDAQRIMRKPPWQFHHKVELQNKTAPNKPVAKQEFYQLANDLPLFAACPVISNTEHLRINLYVHDFSRMVEFYRIITETEIETSKPAFCIFELYRQPGLNIQLSLKHSPYLYPLPVESAYISFNVRSIAAIKVALNVRNIECVGGNVFTTKDPDGNLVILYENDQAHQDLFCELANTVCNKSLVVSPKCHSCLSDKSRFTFDDGKSLQSTTESHDSGRYSDLDGGKYENGIATVNSKQHSRQGRIKSEGYASSDSGSSETIVNDAKARGSSRANTLPSKGKVSSSKATNPRVTFANEGKARSDVRASNDKKGVTRNPSQSDNSRNDLQQIAVGAVKTNPGIQRKTSSLNNTQVHASRTMSNSSKVAQKRDASYPAIYI